ncbi:DUF6461 domain-containing protein [Streptomyces sp. NPDC001876]|uniref:DUF6461 domain-containing protein n=1 Tax=Streptomyces sp. NPDC001876 TaxID=3154402 RepID=UPI00332FB060
MDGIRWLSAESHFDLGYWVVFARGIGPEELLDRMGAEAGSVRRLDRFDAGDLMDELDTAVLRAGESCGWAFAVSEGGPGGTNSSQALSSASAGSEAVEFWRTVNQDKMFAYARNGEEVFRCEPGQVHPLPTGGFSPDSVSAASLGLPGTAADTAIGSERDALTVAEEVFGLNLPKDEVLEGVLLTAPLP